MKYDLIFSNCNDQRRVIGQVETVDEAFNQIKAFCDEREFRVYCIRYWIEPEGIETEFGINDRWNMTFDCGSWSEFFHIYFDTEQEANQFLDTMK